jgi:hypothetical protein
LENEKSGKKQAVNVNDAAEGDDEEEGLQQPEDIRQLAKRMEQDNQLQAAFTTLKNLSRPAGQRQK